MICKKCGNSIPDSCQICPACGNLIRRRKRKRGLSVLSAVLLSPLLNFLMGGFNLLVLFSVGHYPTSMEGGLALAIQRMYFAHPSLKAVNLIFGILFVASFILSVVATYYTQHYGSIGPIGPILTIIAHGTQLCWTVLYPSVFYFIVGVASPILSMTMGVTAVYTALATVFTLRICRSGIFLT